MKHRTRLTTATLLVASCATTPAPKSPPEAPPAEGAAPEPENPFFSESSLPLRYPAFDGIRDEHFAPAFDRGMATQLEEMRAIANDPAEPTFENTLVAMERTGEILQRVSTVFFNLEVADTNPARQQLKAAYAPKLAAHRDAVLLDPKLFARVEALHARRAELGLDPEGRRLVERYHVAFVRAGARLGDGDKARLAEINAELATLSARFGENVLAGVNASAVVVEAVEALAGLSEAQITAAAEAAKARGLEGKYVLTLQNTTGQPPNTHLRDRALRRRLHEASVARNARGDAHDNTEIVARTARLRAERARLLGYEDHAAYVLDDATAGSIEAVNARLSGLAPRAAANARKEGADIAAMLKKDLAKEKGADHTLHPWDWAYYAEKVREERFAFDEAQLRPYLEMNRVLEDGVFFAAQKLYGLRFQARHDLPVYHPDVRVFDVFEEDGTQLAIFLVDLYARPSKRGGAWMNAYVPQSGLHGRKPVIANHLNVPKPAEGQPTLLTWDEVTTLFHEFGHALHGMFSNVRYPYFAGTNVPRDFVEYPSQVNEMWAVWPEVLSNYARHHLTGEPMPKALVDKIIASEQFNQGFRTSEYLAAAILDQRWHQMTADQVPEAGGVMAFEASALKAAGLDYAPVPPRYRTPYFSHIWGGGYHAGYYSYIWSEVLDADTVEWFEESGGLLRKNGDHFRATLLSRGGAEDAMTLYREFRGRDARIEPLLRRRGLEQATTGKGPRR